MNADLVMLAVTVGAANWAFRVLPMKMALRGADGPLGRFLAATGPAAIATLFVASVLPQVQSDGLTVPLIGGVAGVAAVFAATRSVALATIAGAAAYGGITALLG